MEHPFVVSGGESQGHLARDADRGVFGQPALAVEQGCEALAVDPLHREECPSVRLHDVVHAADVRVGDPARDAHLADQPREPSLVGAERIRQNLDRGRLAELEVVRLVDLPLSASSGQGEDPVATRQHRAGIKENGFAG